MLENSRITQTNQEIAGSARFFSSLLEDAGWVRKAEPEISRNGGRPSEAWTLNPKVAVYVK
jgi:hypothetical protein